jgi:hypothetical protein
MAGTRSLASLHWWLTLRRCRSSTSKRSSSLIMSGRWTAGVIGNP